MKVLVTGGSGFLGINLIRHLLKQGITEIVNLDFADFDYPEKDKIIDIRGDIRDINMVKKAMEGVNMVIHCAAALPLYTDEEIMTTDVDGTRNVITEAFNNNVDRFVHISSTAVYGIPDHHPLLENDKMIGVGPYGKAKILAEEECLKFKEKGMCVSIIRPKSFVGPERLGVFAMFYEWAKEGHGFPMIGNGKNRYQLLDVEDLCCAIWLCLTEDKKVANDIYNIAAKEFTTLKEDYQAVLDTAGFGKKISCFPATPMIWTLRILEFFKLSPLYKWIYETVSKDSFVSIEKAEKQLGYKPKYSTRDALVRNYLWYLNEYKSHQDQTSGISHRVPWKQGILGFAKYFF